MSQTDNAKDKAMTGAVITAEKLVTLEESRTRSRMLAYQNVASRISRGGSVPAEIAYAFDSMLIKHLEAQFVRLQAELDVARQSGAHPACEHLSEIESHLSKVRALLNGGVQ